MDLRELKVLFTLALICLAGVNSLDGIELSPPSLNQYEQPPKNTANINPLHSPSIHGKLLSDVKDEMAANLAPNAANLTEARITSITFRSVDGDTDPTAIDRDSGETISFGIRSFTVKVASAGTEKPIPLGDVVSQNGRQPFLLPEMVEAAKQPFHVEILNEPDNIGDADLLTPAIGRERAQMEKFQQQPKPLPVNTQRSNVFGATPHTIDGSANVDAANQRHNNKPKQLSLSSNGMHIEQKLENGLYRIKIAEIITDEFNNGQNTKNANEERLNEIESSMQRYPKPTHSSGQVNIADLFPSKMEDFASIIRDSNEKMIREKNRRVGIDADSSRLNVVDQPNEKHSNNDENKGKIFLNQPKQFKAMANGNEIPAAIESNAMKATPLKALLEASDKETDFTSKLQVNDEMISQIEHSFRESSEPHPPIQPVIMVNKPMQFIERRVKKFDASVKKLPTSTKQLAAIATNHQLNADAIDANTISPLDDNPNTNKGKLIESKALKNKESLSNNVRSSKKWSTIKTPSPNNYSLPAQIFDERNKANETADQTHAQHKIVLPATLATITASNEQQFLFINVNDNRASNKAGVDAAEMARLENDRNRIIEDSKRVVGETKPTAKNGMHVFIMHDDGSNQTTSTNYNDTIRKEFASSANVERITLTNQPNANANLSQPTPKTTSSTSTAIDAISLVDSNLQAHTSTNGHQPNESITSRPATQPFVSSNETPAATLATSTRTVHAAVNLMSKAYGQQRGYYGFLFDTECDMQTPIPADASLWRGNETHELSLPTTVSFNTVLTLNCSYCSRKWQVFFFFNRWYARNSIFN